MIGPSKLCRTSRVTWFGFFAGTSRKKARPNRCARGVAWLASCRSCSAGWTCLHFRHQAKAHFERLKPHHSGPTELATTPLNTDEIAVIIDPEPERSVERINDYLLNPRKSLNNYFYRVRMSHCIRADDIG